MENELSDSISVLEKFESLYMQSRHRWERQKVQTDARRVLNEAAYVMFMDFAIAWLMARNEENELKLKSQG